MYGDLGFYGAAPAKGAGKKEKALRARLKSLQAKLRKAQANLVKTADFGKRARINANILKFRKQIAQVQAQLVAIRTRRAFRGSRAGGVAAAAGSSAVVQRGILSADEEALIKQLIEALKARGVDEDVAEEVAKEKVLPPQKRGFFAPGFFRGIRRAGPRPVLPQTRQQYFAPVPGTLPMPTRSIDPTLQQMSIDPRIAQHDIDPFIQQRSIDPQIYQQSLVPQDGSFTFPPGNVSDVDPDTIIDIEGFGGIVENVKEFVSKPWVLAGLGVAALFYGSKALTRKKVKSNPKRRRHNRRRR